MSIPLSVCTKANTLVCVLFSPKPNVGSLLFKEIYRELQNKIDCILKLEKPAMSFN